MTTTTPRLSRRERQVLTLMADGRTSREIGDALGTSEETVRAQRAALFRKIGARNAAHAITLGHATGLLDTGNAVNGSCPGCGFTTLVRHSDGTIACSRQTCPAPDATDRLLAEGETEHIVTVTPGGWTVTHPLRERAENGVDYCSLPGHLAALTYTPTPGRYRAVDLDINAGAWTMEYLP